jgi:hypothetical protein
MAKAAILIASVLAVTPAAATVFWPKNAETVNPARSIELSGPILGFTQSRERIQVRLVAPSEHEQRSEIVVRNASGEVSQTIPLKRGQTWASAKLNAELADAPELQISVE